MRFMRGAKPTPRHVLARSIPHTPDLTIPLPPSFLCPNAGLSMWGNDVNGDCVTAEEAFAKSCRTPDGGILLPDSTVIGWASSHDVLNGAGLTEVMDSMRKDGFNLNTSTYDDGPYVSVDWTTPSSLQAAILEGPIKIGVAADQLQTTVEAVADGAPWVATGYAQDTNEDHCVSLCGYGTIDQLALALNLSLSATIDGTQLAYALFTWNSIGIIDDASMKAITGEAWLRNPTTVIGG